MGLLVATLVTGLALSYVRSERLHLVDQQIRATAFALVNSELSELRRGEFEEAEDVISEELGPQRIGKIFIVRNAKGEVLFQSQSAGTLTTAIPQTPQWVDHFEGGRWIRVLNLALPKISDRTLQVGAVLDAGMLGGETLSWRTAVFAIAALCVTLLAAFMLSSFVMRPFRRLNEHLVDVSQDLSRFRSVRRIPSKGFEFALRREDDEFGQTLTTLNELITRINETARTTRLWSMRLAHQMKTPITILRLEVEDSAIPERSRKSMVDEVDHMARMVHGFLSWAEAGDEGPESELPNVSLAGLTQEVVNRLERIADGRLVMNVESDRSLRVLPEHLDLVLTNLIENALKYSPPGTQVHVYVRADGFEVVDQGGGLPPHVRDALGSPFNRGADTQTKQVSSGLGLALVQALCRRYGWTLTFEASRNGQAANVRMSLN